MKIIPRNANILSLSHNDLDGVAAQIVLGHIYENITFMNVSFYKIDEILHSLNYDKYDYVILTDICPDNRDNLYLSDKIVLIDHHESALDMNNPSKMHFVIEGVCGALLTKRFVEKMYGTKLSHLDDLIALVNDYDMWILDNPNSKHMNDIMFYKYRPNKFRDTFFDGRTEFTESEMTWIADREKKFERLYEELEVFELDKINGVVINAREFINEIAKRLMDEEGYNIVFIRNPSNERVSIRHNLDDLDMGGLLKELGFGGGHRRSAGCFSKDLNDFQTKLGILQDEIAKNFPKES